MNNQSNVKKVIGVVSGKGGVGKSSVTSILAVATQRLGYKVAILDADITGPSIPQAFGIRSKATGTDEEITPVVSKTGIKVISINALLEDTTDPVVWRGPVLSGVIDQFWNNVVWGDIDVMYVDMPPGTGDVALTVFQSLPLDGLVIVTSPQELVSMIVEKAVKMAQLMKRIFLIISVRTAAQDTRSSVTVMWQRSLQNTASRRSRRSRSITRSRQLVIKA